MPKKADKPLTTKVLEKKPERNGLRLADFEFEVPPKAKPGEPQNYPEQIYCKVCGQKYDVVACKCGKFGTREMMDKHIKDRHAKGTKSAKEAHQLVRLVKNRLGYLTARGDDDPVDG